MKLFVILALLAVATLASPQCAVAANWVAVTTDGNQDQVSLDTSSVRMFGGYVLSWQRVTAPRPSWDKIGKKWYRITQAERMDDCRQRVFSFVAFQHLDDQGLVTASDNLPQAQWVFQSPPPGSVTEAVQNQVCSLIARRAALKPYLNEGPATQGDWRAAAYDPVHQIDYAVDMKTIGQLKNGAIGFVEKASNRIPQKLTDGTEYNTAFMLVTLDCAKGTFMIVASDLYDSSGSLVGGGAASSGPEAIVAGTIVEAVRNIACAAQPAAASNGDANEPQLSSGTAWLMPKGYLITANHVVEGGAAFGLIQDGKTVGEAEVVLTDPANDVALLRPKFVDGPHPAIPLREASARLGERVFTLGYPAPDILGLSVKMTSGEVSALSGNDAATGRIDDVRFLQISVPAQPGNSGGPLIDAAGRAVGIVDSRIDAIGEHAAAQNVNFAVKIGYVRNLLEGLPDIGGHLPVKPAAGMTAEVADLRGAVFLLVVSSQPAKSPGR